MSVYATCAEIGIRDETDETDGTVLAYSASGFPTTERHAWVSTAQIPAWCVPGRFDEHSDDFERVAEYLRLDVSGDGQWITSTVVLTESSARALRDELDRWLALPKLHSTPEAGQ